MSLDEAILDSVRAKPESWSIVIGSHVYSKQDVLMLWSKDKELRENLRKIVVSGTLHFMGQTG